MLVELYKISQSQLLKDKKFAHLVIETLRKHRCDEKFELFWSNLMNKKAARFEAAT